MRLMLSKRRIRKKCQDSQLRRYPEDWVCEFVEGDGKDFDLGMDMTECGIYKFYKMQGAEQYVPYLCLGDYPQFRAFGIGMKRTQTLGNGAPKCDFRFKKRGKTPKGWPPEKNRRVERKGLNTGGVRNSAVASQSCPSGHITTDKRPRYASPKLPSATSFIHRTLGEMANNREDSVDR